MPTRHRMALGLYDARGHRKYLTTAERTAFLIAAEEALREVRTLCGLLAHTGCRLSEALWLTADRVDFRADLVVFETLKKRHSGVYRAVPVPHTLVDMLDLVHGLRPLQGRSDHGRNHRLWSWSRMTGWRRVCEVMARAGVRGPQASPKGLRHGFGVAAVTAGVPLNLVQKWLGHAQLSTTAIYADAVGEEEHAMAARMWRGQAEHHPAPRAPHGYELPMHGQALHGQLPCPVKARTRARVLTNTGLHTARGGARVVRAKTLALRWSASGRLCRASHPPRSDLCGTLTLYGIAQWRAVCRAYTLAAKRRLSSLWRRRSREQRGPSHRPRVPMPVHCTQRQTPIQ